jgi:hypothetical protein
MTTQFLPWKEQVAAWTDAARLRESQVRQTISDLTADLTARTEAVTNTLTAGAVELAERTRTRCEQLPAEIVAEVRRHVNLLDLATRADVETVSKLGRSRVSFVLKEFLEAQKGRDEALLKALRSEIRDELQTFAAVIDDDLFATTALPRAPAPPPRRPRSPSADIDYFDDDDDLDEHDEHDERDDLVEYYGMRLPDEDEEDDDEIDLLDGTGRAKA